MYINWVHHYIPKLFGGLAFVVNPIFVYFIFNQKSANFGNYRFLLLFFASFDLLYSATVFLLPVHVYNYRYSFTVFVSDGWFEKSSELNFVLLCARCSLISGSYGILLSHFFYRFLAVKSSQFIGQDFHIFMSFSFVIFLGYSAIWFLVGFCLTSVPGEDYIRESFSRNFGVDPYDLNVIIAIYNEASDADIFWSYFGVILLTVVSILSILMFVILGSLTMKKINQMSVSMSRKTSQLQRELLKSLTVQTVIPFAISFSPCLLGWYSPMFNLDLGRVISLIEVVTLAAFPFLDPIAIVLCVSALRKRILFWKRKDNKVQTTDANKSTN